MNVVIKLYDIHESAVSYIVCVCLNDMGFKKCSLMNFKWLIQIVNF